MTARTPPVLSVIWNWRNAAFCTTSVARRSSSMPGKLDDDAVVAGLLHDRLRDAELVDARADDLERAIERLALVLR